MGLRCRAINKTNRASPKPTEEASPTAPAAETESASPASAADQSPARSDAPAAVADAAVVGEDAADGDASIALPQAPRRRSSSDDWDCEYVPHPQFPDLPGVVPLTFTLTMHACLSLKPSERPTFDQVRLLRPP